MKFIFFVVVLFFQTIIFSQTGNEDSLNVDGPILQLDTNIFDFGKIPAHKERGCTHKNFVKIKNVGNKPLIVTRAVISTGGVYADYRDCQKPLFPGDSSIITIHYGSHRYGLKFQGSLTIRSNSIDGEVKVVRIKGEFVKSDLQKLHDSISGPILMIDTSQLNLGDIPKSDSEYIIKRIYISNSGVEPLRIMGLESLRDGLLIPRFDYSQNPILPGEVGAIFIQIKTVGLDEGSYNRKIYVGSNSGDNEKKSFLISWRLTKSLGID